MAVDELQAGAELNAKVAEKVMGWEAKIFSAPDVRDPLKP